MTNQPSLETIVPPTKPGGSTATAEAENIYVTLARELALSHEVSARVPVRRLLILNTPEFFEGLLRRAYQHFSQVAEGELIASYAGEWLLDNYYIVQQALRQVQEDMPRRYYTELPRLASTDLQGYPRIYSLARAFTDVADHQFSLQQVSTLTEAYQDHAPLTMGELWAWPVMLRVSMLENLALALNSLLPLGAEPGEIAPVAAPVGPARDSSAETIVAHCITSLRQLGTQDWAAFFEATSRVETILRRDPAATYAQMDFDTRNRYRQVIETIARRAPSSEEQVAQAALTLAQGAAERNGHMGSRLDIPFLEDPASHVGFYLIGQGRQQTESAVRCQITWGERLVRWTADRRLLFYLGGVLLLTLAISLLSARYAALAGGSLIQAVAAGLLAFLPASAIAVSLVNWAASRLGAPHVLPKMDFSEGIPDAYRTMVIIPALLTDEAEVDSLANQLELHYLRNGDPNLNFAILADYTDGPEPHMPGDEVLLERAQNRIRILNERHGADQRPFFLFLRERRWNPAENVWMGYERKRGKLMEFNRLILDPAAETSYTVQVGDLSVMPSIRYVITLDADTVLPRDSAQRLVGTLAHPLNQARFADDGEQLAGGYTILQPRVEIFPTAASRTRFSRIFAGDTGLDLYSLAVSDTYQDLFGEGIYIGKGIYDVAAFERSLKGRTPDNRLLSHDLFEGMHGRVALVTDIVLLEDYPSHYLAYTRRMQRWIRGDWQLLPWLLPRVPAEGGAAPNRFSALDFWKIVDNLRRSLVQPALLLLLLLSWLWLPGSPFVWSVLALIALSVPFLISAINQFADISPENGWNVARRRSFVRETLRWVCSIVFLPYEAFLSLDAILTTLFRLARRKHLLQWTTAASTMQLFGAQPSVVVWHQVAAALGFALVVGGAVALIRPGALLLALSLLAIWLYSPYAVVRLSQPVARRSEPLSPADLSELRILARRTWLYFEEFIRPEGSWLPPDHYQAAPRAIVAWQTSPTNIGLTLLSTLAAYDIGYIGLLELDVRLRFAFDAIDEMEKYRGHLLNWYDTRTLRPLMPRYVSTVDSGNLAGSLIALQYGIQDLFSTPILRRKRWDGISDTIGVLDEILDEIEARHPQVQAGGIRAALAQMQQRIEAGRDQPDTWMALLTRLTGQGWNDLNQFQLSFVETEGERLDAARLSELRIYLERLRHYLFSFQRDVELLQPWLVLLDQVPDFSALGASDPAIQDRWQALNESLPLLPGFGDVRAIHQRAHARLDGLMAQLTPDAEHDPVRQAALDWCRALAEALTTAEVAASDLVQDFEHLQRHAADTVAGMDFGFLYDTNRHLFHIGYNVATEQLDNSYYDLLASEARLASLIAIAKEDVPQKHWLHLARPVTQLGDRQALLSWSGTMFEYLMPRLLMHTYDGTLLDESAHAVVEHQMAYGQQTDVPWGISESGYHAFDSSMNYQYRAFGVPGLAFKRGQGDDLVVAPYASLLALPIRPRAVLDNLERFKALGARDAYGLVEAIDYTPRHLPLGQEYAVVREYMAHHQAMIFLTLINFMHDDVMIKRFHRDPRVQSVELLLQEQLAQSGFTDLPAEQETPPEREEVPPLVTAPWRPDLRAPLPELHYLSNGRYSVMLTAAGSGYSAWEGAALTRWRADTTLDDWGTWIYIRDEDSGAVWSVGYQPVGAQPDTQDVLFFAHKAEIQRRDGDISSRLELVVPPEDDLEIRRVTLTNHGDDARRLTLVSYAEVVLAPQAGDQRHPAFNKLFIESEFIPEHRALLFRRRPRSAHEMPLYALHMLVTPEGFSDGLQVETDRARFLGRGRTPRDPVALAGEQVVLSGTVGATLDPIMALGQVVELPPHSTVEVAFITAGANTRAHLLDLAERYRHIWRIDQAFDHARFRSEREMRQLGLDTEAIAPIQRLLAALLYPHPVLRADPAVLAANTRAQPGLWAFGVSGDYPILLAEIEDETQLDLVHELIQAHTYWRNRDIHITLVILNLHDTSYLQRLDQQIHRLIVHAAAEMQINQHSGIFILRADQMSEADRTLLRTAARAVLRGGDGSLRDQIAQRQWQSVTLPAFVPVPGGEPVPESDPPVARPDNLRFDNGLGGFSPDGREYVIYLQPGQPTPAPWINVVANEQAGFIISETGGGFSWAENSGENRLTAWRNDPVSDLPAEALYLRDEETARIWSPTPLPAPDGAPTLVRHGAGYSSFEHHSHRLEQHLTLFCPPDDPVKIVRLRLKNMGSRPRRITATYYAEWVLGPTRDLTQQYLVPDYDADDHTLLFRNPYSIEFGPYHAFITASQPFHGLTTNRTEFLGRMGSLARPAALERIGLSGLIRPGLDPCAAIQLHIDLPPGEETEVFFVIGQGADRQQALELSRRYRDPAAVADAWTAVTSFWREVLDSITIETPDDAMNLLMPWLLYQALACRIWGRSALYQSSGAYGFRDQLQDVLALIHTRPGLTRAHILRAARHQFEAGDVLHWWHPPSGRGVRTRFSDDLIWLPFVVAHYVAATGDESVLREEVPFLRGELLKPEEEERYGFYETTAEAHTIYEHCRRALEQGTTTGRHGLPLMRAGDWNDGMNRVGIQGRGESVWLAWFLLQTMDRFRPLCALMDDTAQADIFQTRMAELQAAVERHAWDGEWYMRAYYDDGTRLGSAQNQECQIDSLGQSWGVLSGAASPARARQAMESVQKHLIRTDDQLLLLFTPPFDRTPRDPGYIKGYPPGIRENGGQYTHAALWVIWAFAEMGHGDLAGALFEMLNPIRHSDTPEKAAHYRVEPYVIAADVYSAPPHTGRGGWTWYSGSSGWMYRLGIEAILGLRREGAALRIDPRIPRAWPHFQVSYHYGQSVYHIRVENPDGVQCGVKTVVLDGQTLDANVIPLHDDGAAHQVEVRLG